MRLLDAVVVEAMGSPERGRHMRARQNPARTMQRVSRCEIRGELADSSGDSTVI